MFNTQQNDYLDAKEAYLDSFIEKDDEQLLFESSYIHGHFSVVAAKLSKALSHAQHSADSTAELAPDGDEPSSMSAKDAEALEDMTTFANTFRHLLSADIQKAIDNQELSESDAKGVVAMLNSLFK
ncbi:YfcL family protein [Glaciecola siphonariae]|uniref:YfcL family protein n=1 Tax=Glaciecola siphonariae TaxID=521012 RepID=A0ABV9LWC6_9ALTE